MNWTSCKAKLLHYVLPTLPALVILIVGAAFLTGCSELLAEMNAQAKEPVPQVVQNDAKMPDVPPHLVKCIEAAPKPGATADQKVANLKLTADERKACAKAILAWYKTIQAANKQAAKPKT